MLRAMLGILTIAALADGDFSEFDRPTVDFAQPHIVKAGDQICAEHESVEAPTLSDCYTVHRDAKVTVKYVIHGITKPQFFVEPLDKRLRQGWVYRSQITD